ncbi:EAL domain-containing protein [Virgibacillus sp. C22-A2]|uniref:EAL domain-containing protein n=1 Tax=Virgibacillus tibetensis TaxID=3042313 RepID=A0ABU6KC61_9BACI|nr:EAL domain-containing protein [Virgibacillus sp. C22-A2]
MGTEQDIYIHELDFHHVIQPIFDLSKNNIYGYEVLLRSQEIQNPEILFNYAKEKNQLFELDMRSILSACENFNKNSSLLSGLYIFINVFPSTLINPDFYERMQRLANVMSLRPESIVFEINESEKGTDMQALKTGISAIKRLGFLVALDDIGKGESTVQSIVQLEPNIAKLDRIFAKDLTKSPKKQSIITMILQLLGKDTIFIVEGFESEADLLTAKGLGVPFGQGFFLGKPKPLNHYLANFE